jgi:hypothetical protein
VSDAEEEIALTSRGDGLHSLLKRGRTAYFGNKLVVPLFFGILMNRKKTRRIILGGLLGLGLAMYIAAKIDTFTRWDSSAPGVFIRKHSLY